VDTPQLLSHTFLEDLRLHGARHANEVHLLLGDAFETALRRRELKLVTTNSGKVIVLGDKSRQRLGLGRSTTTPEAFEDDLVRRRVLQHYLQDGFVFDTYVGNLMKVRSENTMKWIAAKQRGYSLRAINRLLKNHSLDLMLEQATLEVWTPFPEAFASRPSELVTVRDITLLETP
jgi:hypothetical protein